jgi:predicted RNA-binding Zn-ribbon protein involved in translation (DUF1610 family)
VAIRVTCNSFGAASIAPDGAAGKRAKCPNCGTQNQIAALGAIVPPRPAAVATPPDLPSRSSPSASDFITLACPSCGGSLKITSNADRFACKYCSREHLVRRENGILSVTPVLEKLDRIVSGVDRHASELAISRLKRECHDIEGRIADAWNYIESWQDHVDKRKSAAITHCILIGVIGIVISLCGASLHGAFPVILVFLTIGVCVLVVITSRPDRNWIERVRKARARIDDLEGSLTECRRELRKHYDNVRI